MHFLHGESLCIWPLTCKSNINPETKQKALVLGQKALELGLFLVTNMTILWENKVVKTTTSRYCIHHKGLNTLICNTSKEALKYMATFSSIQYNCLREDLEALTPHYVL